MGVLMCTRLHMVYVWKYYFTKVHIYMHVGTLASTIPKEVELCH